MRPGKDGIAPQGVLTAGGHPSGTWGLRGYPQLNFKHEHKSDYKIETRLPAISKLTVKTLLFPFPSAPPAHLPRPLRVISRLGERDLLQHQPAARAEKEGRISDGDGAKRELQTGGRGRHWCYSSGKQLKMKEVFMESGGWVIMWYTGDVDRWGIFHIGGLTGRKKKNIYLLT